MPESSWSDAWVFWSIVSASANDAGDLSSVIAYGDAINHAIVTYAELHNGLSKLTAHGLIEEVDGLFAPTPKAIEIMGEGRRSRQEARIAKALGGLVEWSKDYDPSLMREDPYPGLTRGRYEAALSRT